MGIEYVDGDYRWEVCGDYVYYVGDDSCCLFWIGLGVYYWFYLYLYWDKVYYGYGI